MIIICILILLLTIFLLLHTIHEPPCMKEVKRRYNILINNCPEKFKVLKKRILISGYSKSFTGTLGWNSNKGDEIGICIDGTPNQTFHILLHELAHSTVEEYSHSKQFWKNFKELRDICENLGIYNPIDYQEKFCGKYIKDN